MRKETNRMGMADFFIAPIQRVPRYCLLLKDITLYLPFLLLPYISKFITLTFA